MRRGRMTSRAMRVVAVSLGLAACRSTPIEPVGPPVETTTITITNNAASPRNIEVPLGSRVLFINNDSRSHNMTSDPHPEHDLCPELNQIGFLSAGQRRESGNLVFAGKCGFHDHDNPNTNALTGIITIK